MSQNDVSVVFGANISGLVAGVESVKAKLGTVADAVDGIKSTFSGFGSALAGAFAVNQVTRFTESILALNSRMEDLQATTGFTVEKLQAMRFVLDNNDQKVGQFTQAITTFSERAQEAAKGTGAAAEAFKAMGINVKEYLATGGTLEDLFDSTTKKIDTYKNSLEKTTLIGDLYGSKAKKLAEDLHKYAVGQEAANEAVEKSGSIMQGAQERASDTQKKVTELGQSFEGTGQRIFAVFKPAIDGVISGLTYLAQAFNDAYDNAGFFRDIMILLEGTFKVLTSSVMLLSTYFEALWEVAKTGAAQTYLTIRQLGVAMAALAKGDLEGVKNAWKDYTEFTRDNGESMLDKIIAKNEQAAKRLKEIWGGVKIETPDEGKADAPETGGGPAANLEKWENDLNKMLLDKQLFGQAAEQEELKYWQNILATAEVGAKERAAIEKKIYDLQNNQWQDAANNAARAERERIKAMQQAAKEIERINQKTTEEATKRWERFFKSFNNGLLGMAKGTMTWKEGIKDMFWGVVGNWLQAIERMMAAWIVKETVQTGATVAGNAARTTSDVAAAKASGQAFGESGKATIMGDAAKAYSGVYGFLAPEIGPFAAIPAGLAFASVAAMEALIPSYDVGSWNIPNDTLAMVHKGEMIIPAAQAAAVRSGASGGGGGGITINGDVYGFRDFQAKVAQAVGGASRNFNPNLTRGLK